MLKREHPTRMMHQDAMHRSLRFLSQHPLSTIMTILIIAVTLMLAVLCWMMTHHAEEFKSSWQRDGHISLYLKDSLSPIEQQQLLAKVNTTPGVAAVSFTSPEEGLALLSEQEGLNDVAQYLQKNPLPAVIDVTPEASLATPEAVDRLYQRLKSLPDIEEAKLDLDWIGRLYAVLGFVMALMKGLMMILTMAVVLVISNTLRLIIVHRQDEIQILQLLGATDAYIMRPFLYSGLYYGLFAACWAIVGVDVFIFLLRSGINQWAKLYQMHFAVPMMSFSLMIGVIVVAISLGWLAARLTVKRYL